ncbi:junctional sarcoplasmic reticulum protein 1 isoform X2 [Ascaphus truei]|uniref:junctional sarcoplasmic reticulum protein 1 isoform X2 n=1 Tax=Ascaphus truei TaxID=8439 RepID=UPI003F595A87
MPRGQGGEEVKRSKEEIIISQAAETEPSKKYDLQITEELEEFVESASEPSEEAPSPVSIPSKRSAIEAKPESTVPTGAAARRRPEPKSLGPVREEDAAPWECITLNKCLVVAAFVALLSVGFQVLQDGVDTEDEVSKVDAVSWTQHYSSLPPDINDQLPEPWFFEGWFSSSESKESELAKVKEKQPAKEEQPAKAKEEQPAKEEPPAKAKEEQPAKAKEEQPAKAKEEQPAKAKEEQPAEAPAAPVTQKPPESEREESHAKQKQSEQWGLKAKSKYMEAKASKIRRSSGEGSQRREVFPFMKKPKESPKPLGEVQEKAYKERGHQHKSELGGRRSDYPRKQRAEGGKQHRKGREEPKKYFKQEEKEKYKGWREEKQHKGARQHQKERDYSKHQDSRRHG